MLTLETREALSLVRYDQRMEIARSVLNFADGQMMAEARDVWSGKVIARSLRIGHITHEMPDRLSFEMVKARMGRRGFYHLGDGMFVRHVQTAVALRLNDNRPAVHYTPRSGDTVSEGDLRTIGLVKAMADQLDGYRRDLLCSILSEFAIDGGDIAREDPYGLVCSEETMEKYVDRPPLIFGLDLDGTQALWDLEETLSGAMEDICPDGCAYGARPDDGALFGFWSVDEYPITADNDA